MDKTITVAPRDALLTRNYIDDLSASVSQVPLSRRALIEEGTQVLYDCEEQGWCILTSEGKEIEVYPGAFDDAHSPNSDGEWISDHRRRSVDGPRRGPRKTLLGRLRLYDALFRCAGVPVGKEARRVEVAEMRSVVREMTPITRARYVNEVRKLRVAHRYNAPLHFGAAVKRLRIRVSQEREAWLTQG